MNLLGGQEFVAADVLALLSGVNFNSIVKVVAAIHALHQYSGTPIPPLLNLSAVPLNRVEVDDPAYAGRMENTLRVCRAIAENADDTIDDILFLQGRFR